MLETSTRQFLFTGIFNQKSWKADAAEMRCKQKDKQEGGAH